LILTLWVISIIIFLTVWIMPLSELSVELGALGDVFAAVTLIVSVATIIVDYKSKTIRVKTALTTKEEPDASNLSDGLHGSFQLSEQTINEEVDYGSPGVYALGHKNGETFIIDLIGRSDTNLNAQLKKHIGKYDRFKFETTEIPSYAFIKECELYHSLLDPGNRIIHPDPGGMPWSCPKCDAFNSQDQIKGAAPNEAKTAIDQTAASTVHSAFCHQCGTKSTSDDIYCRNCGARLISKEKDPSDLTAPR
jgi:DNA-directed RNA polymerase subunit RPC12/RpoP